MTTAEAIREMLNAWTKIEAAARQQFPNASEEEIYEICKTAMNHAIKNG